MIIGPLFGKDEDDQDCALEEHADVQDDGILVEMGSEFVECDDFKIVCKRWRQVSRQWACEYPNLLCEMILARQSLTPLVTMMAKQFLGLDLDHFGCRHCRL